MPRKGGRKKSTSRKKGGYRPIRSSMSQKARKSWIKRHGGTSRSRTTGDLKQSNLERDAQRKKVALPPGRRVSASGGRYTERRRNRSDSVKVNLKGTRKVKKGGYGYF